MRTRRAWVILAAAVVVTLLFGRWLAVSTADSLWAHALGVGATLDHLRHVRTLLAVTAFAAATVWAVGNVFLVYRSIGAVQLPRRLGNLVILEVVPRRYLLIGTLVVGFILGIALSHGAGEWWSARVLAGAAAHVGLVDPVLGRDAGYYLFRLPWDRTVHSFASRLVAVMLVVTVLLYVMVGAIRWRRRGLRTTDLARWHVAGLLLAAAGMLYWGYRLEPVEFVGGLQAVPLDTVLTGVRIPVARLLAGLALLAAVGSIAWMWIPRAVIAGVPWVALAVVSLVGHYFLPAFAGTSRSPDSLVLAGVRGDEVAFRSLGFGPVVREISLGPGVGDRKVPLEPALRGTPTWDHFAVALALNRGSLGSGGPLGDPSLGMYRGADGHGYPVFVSPRTRVAMPRSDSASPVTWERTHAGDLAWARGAAAVAADRSMDDGAVAYVGTTTAPDSGVARPVTLQLVDPTMRITVGAGPFGLAPEDADSVRGVPVGGLGRRLALAWVLQSPRLLSPKQVDRRTLVVWRRDVVERLEAYAPFAEFGRPRSIVVGDRLKWIADGYVWSRAFPVAPAVRWRDRTVRYLRAGFVGVVDAASGDVAVYLLRGADPLSSAWADLAPQIVRPVSELPRDLMEHVPYPAELLDVQITLAAARPSGSSNAGSGGQVVTRARAAYWWVGALAADGTRRLRRLADAEDRETGALVAIADGTVREGRPVLEIYRPDPANPLPGPSQAARRLAGDAAHGVQGTLRMIPTVDGIVAIQSTYQSPSDSAAPRLADVGVQWGGDVGHGSSLESAIARLGGPDEGGRTEWNRARDWFTRLDAARRTGDWAAFGRAYEALRHLLVGGADTGR